MVPKWKKRVPFSVLVALVVSVGITTVFVSLVSPGCAPFSLVGDYELRLEGTAPEASWVRFEVNVREVSVDVESGESAEQIGQRLTEKMKASGLSVDCEKYDGEQYTFVVRNVDGFPDLRTSHLVGMVMGVGGPIQDRPERVEDDAMRFFIFLNANDVAGVRNMTTPEFFREQVSDMMASMAASGEQVVIESMEEPTIDCYQATIGLSLVWMAGAEQQHVDTCLMLTKSSPRGEWLVSGGVIR